MTIKVVGLGGGLLRRSISLEVLKVALSGASDAGANTMLFDLNQMTLPMYTPEYSAVPPSIRQFCDEVYSAQAMIWSSPPYHGSVSGAFKNAIDWLTSLGEREPAYLTGKFIGLISISPGVQGLHVLTSMEFMVRSLNGWAIPMLLPVSNTADVFDQDGQLANENLKTQLRAFGQEITRAIKTVDRGLYSDHADPTHRPTLPQEGIDVVTEASKESFPASDPPAW
ncbi:MAG: NAD(P)H-dependent oxidoreductase [Anaerolineae bacterium]|nr:NAD(P)H-dependent oxidoreductase [Anaerolineae bacterium]